MTEACNVAQVVFSSLCHFQSGQIRLAVHIKIRGTLWSLFFRLCTSISNIYHGLFRKVKNVEMVYVLQSDLGTSQLIFKTDKSTNKAPKVFLEN